MGPVLTISGTGGTPTVVSPNSSNVYTSLVETSLPLNNDAYNLHGPRPLPAQSPKPLTITLTGTIAAGSLDTQVIDTRTTTFYTVRGRVRGFSMSP